MKMTHNARMLFSHLLMGGALLLSACHAPNDGIALVDETTFKGEVDGEMAELYTLTNEQGVSLQVTNYGARVVSLWTPDREGNFADIVLGFDKIDSYLSHPSGGSMGATIGRYANRIAGGTFLLNGVSYQLPTNPDGHSLHGGNKGLSRRIWNTDKVTDNQVVFSYISPDNEEGYPGRVLFSVTYTLSAENAVVIEYDAETSQETPINLTNHTFFNLEGEGAASVCNHELQLFANYFLPVDSTTIPLGSFEAVKETPFDFTSPQRIGKEIDNTHKQLALTGGYDHTFVLNNESSNEAELAAILYEPTSGRCLEVWTTQPGIQFYTANQFDGKAVGKGGKHYAARCAVALETQHFPNSPNQPNFPTTTLKLGERYRHLCIYKLGIR